MNFSRIVFGAMNIWQWNLSDKELADHIRFCLDLGITTFDHADIYGHYTEEGRFGAVLKRRSDLRQKVSLTTKCGIKILSPNRPDHTLKSYDATKEHILWSAENSLKELGVERIKLFMIHRPDALLDPEVVAEAFTQLKEDGKVAHFGVSNFSTSQFELVNQYFPLVTNQIEFSITHTQPLYDGTLDQMMRSRLTPTVWSPFGGGELFSESTDPIVKKIQEVAKQLGEKYNASMDQVLLAWVMKHPSRITPIVGSSKIARLESAKKATQLVLSHEDWYRLLEASVGKEVP